MSFEFQTSDYAEEFPRGHWPCLGLREYSQLQMSTKHGHEVTRAHSNNHRMVGALPMLSCLSIGARQWVPATTPTVHRRPYAVRPWVARDTLHATLPRRPQHDPQRETQGQIPPSLTTNMVAVPFLETADLRRSRKQLEDDKTFSDHNIQKETAHVVNSRNGEAPSHQEDRAEKRNPSPRRQSTR